MGKKKKPNVQHVSFVAHRNFLWLKLSVLLCALSLIGYYFTDFDPVRNGGTWYGYTLGVVATLLILWLSLLGIRKRAITQGNWSLKGWTSAHIYLGLSLIIIATLHTGFQFGWNVHTLAYALMILVIVSGIFGLCFYVIIPNRMSTNRAEMGQDEMLNEITTLNRLLNDAAQPLQNEFIPIVREAIDNTRLGGSIFRKLSSHSKSCRTQSALTFFRDEMRKADVNAQADILNIVSVLERKNLLLIRIRKHIRYKTLLQIWLYAHIPFTFALIAALVAHVVSVFYYN
jgi:hypothetical protein